MQQTLTISDRSGNQKLDQVVIEEPLQITLDGLPIAVVMRTPGQDEDLIRGFFLTENIADPSQIRKVDTETRSNHAYVFLEDNASFDASRLQRNLYSASSCGICGKASIEAVHANLPVISSSVRFSSAAVLSAPEKLSAAQKTFRTTGGLHAAGLFSSDGNLVALREDVGRHNAVDKVIGSATAAGINCEQIFLVVSGRLSFEIMQKALAARISLIAAISAPSSLAVEFAQKSNQTLVGFLRPPNFNLYTGQLAD